MFRYLTALSFAALSSASGQAQDHPMLVSTDWLARHLGDPKLVVIHVPHDRGDIRSGHIPGARELPYSDIRVERDGIGTELPPVEQLQRTFENLGVSDDSHVVIYANGTGMAPMASRVFLSLDYLGHPKIALLDGGIAKWRAERRPISTDVTPTTPGHLTPQVRTVTVDADFVSAATGKQGYAFLDTRTTPEYRGTGTRSGLPSEGHIAGARQLEWEQLFSDAETGAFLPEPQLRKLFSDRMSAGDTLITYCLVGYRASMTYFGARLLGYPVRLYDGSYQEWARQSLPVKKGDAP